MVYLFRKRKVSHAWGNPENSDVMPITTGFQTIHDVSTIAKYFDGAEVPTIDDLEKFFSKDTTTTSTDSVFSKDMEFLIENSEEDNKDQENSPTNYDNSILPVSVSVTDEIKLYSDYLTRNSPSNPLPSTSSSAVVSSSSPSSSSPQDGGRSMKFFKMLKDCYPDSYSRTLTIFINTLQVHIIIFHLLYTLINFYTYYYMHVNVYYYAFFFANTSGF